jgi:hypothetical protein
MRLKVMMERMGNARNSSVFKRVNIAVFAPMPSASEIATVVKPGFFSNWRKAKRRS